MRNLLTIALTLLSCGLIAANLLTGDSGYEAGLGYFNRAWYDRGVLLTHSNEGTVPQGRQYATFELPAQANYCYSGNFIRLAAKTDYVFSCWIKTTGKVAAKLGVVNSHWKDTQFHDFTITSEWTRVEVPFQPMLDDEYWLLIDLYSQDDAPQQISFDAVQLENGTAATAFTTDALVTDISIPSEHNQVFFPEEIPTLRLTAYVSRDDTAAPTTFTLRVNDFQGNAIATSEHPVAWQDQIFKQDIQLPVKDLGLYTVHLTWQDAAGQPVTPEQLDSYAVVPHPRATDPEVRPYFGVNSSMPRGVDRLGVRWTEVGAWWCTLQPDRNRYDFDFTLQTIKERKARGYQVKFTLVHLPCTPHWAWRPDEVEEAKSWGFEPNFRFRPAEEAIPELERMFADFLTEAAPYIDLIELGGEDELIGGAEPYYRKKYPQFIENGCVNGPVCVSIAQMVNACIRAAKRICPDKPIAVGRPSGGDCYSNNFGFARNVIKELTEPYDFFGMDCYTYQMRYLDYDNMPNIGSPNRDYPGVFERARSVTADHGTGQLPFVSEYGFAIDNRLAPDDPLQQEETARMLAAALTAKLLGSPIFFWFNTEGCVESGVFDYGMWHRTTPMLLIPAMAQVTQVVEGVRQTDARLGSPEGNLKLGLFGQKDRAVLALWTDRTPNPVRLELPAEATACDFLGNPREIPANGQFTASILPIYIVLKGENAFEQLQSTLKTAEDLDFRLETALKMNDSAIVIQDPVGTATARTLDGKYRFDDAPWNTATKPAGTPLPWKIPVAIPTDAKKLEIQISDNSVPTQTTLFDCATTTLSPGLNLIATFGDERKDIVPPDPHIHWSGKADLGGTITLTCDPETITLEAVITDDLHCHNSDITQLWEGDCFQFAIVPDVNISAVLRNSGYTPEDSEFIFALNAQNGPQWMGYAKEYPAEPDYTIVRDETARTTTYRITLQRKLIGLDTPGQYFRFCCVVFDDDEGGGQSYHYQLSPGVTVTKAPANFPIFRMP